MSASRSRILAFCFLIQGETWSLFWIIIFLNQKTDWQSLNLVGFCTENKSCFLLRHDTCSFHLANCLHTFVIPLLVAVSMLLCFVMIPKSVICGPLEVRYFADICNNFFYLVGMEQYYLVFIVKSVDHWRE